MHPWWIPLLLLAACGPGEAGPGPVGGDPPHDDVVDAPEDTAPPPRPRPDLPPWGDTDVDTARPVDSDPPPIDTGFHDTFVPADTARDSGTPPTWSVTSSTTTNVHDRIHVQGQLLELGPLVVTAVRRTLTPPATNGFAAQDPGAPAPKHGIYVDLRDGLAAPAPGDLVMVTGMYVEWPSHASVPGQTMARLVVHPSIPGTKVIGVGSGAPPTALDVRLDDLANPATAEDLEGLLVRVDEGHTLDVLSTPARTTDEFPVGVPNVVSVMVDPWFFDYVAALPVRPGATVQALAGVLLYEPNDHKVAPRGIDDLEGWTNP